MKRFFVAVITSLAMILSCAPVSALSGTVISITWTLSVSPNVVSQHVLYSNTPVNSLGRFNGPVVITVGPTTTNYTIQGLAPGTYFVAVTCTDATGAESPYSNVVSTVLTAPVLPQPPTGLRIP